MKRLLGFLFFLPVSAWPGVSVGTALDPREAFIGDPLNFTLTLQSSGGDAVLPFAPEKSLGPFEVLDFRAAPPEKTREGFRQSFVYTLAAYEVGVSTLPRVVIGIQSVDGSTSTVSTPDIRVTIKSLLPADARDIRDIKGSFSSFWGTALFLLAVLGGVLIFLRQRGGLSLRSAPPPPPVPCDQSALEALSSLEASPRADAKIFYSALTDILRSYLEARYGVSVMDRTTSEIVLELRRLQISPELRLSSQEVLETGDLAKFARFETDLSERRRHLETVRTLVLQTRQVSPVREP